MAKIYNFDEFKNKLKKTVRTAEEIEMEILLSTIKYVYIHMNNRPEEIFENIKPTSKTAALFNHDRSRFASMFVDLVEYWNLGPLPNEEIPMDEEFERFPTVDDICVFIQEKLTKNTH